MTSGERTFDFSLQSYADTLADYKDHGYAVTGFREYLDDPQEKHMIMRHDIDNSLEQAFRIAKVDAEAGCTSTFFLRVHARGYNLLALPSLVGIREMEDMGHQVELHLEGGLNQWLGGTEVEWADRQKDAFEAALDRPIHGFSSHEPARTGGLAFADAMLDRWSDTVSYHAYQQKFLNPQIKYLSDSSARWREGHFGTWVGKEPHMQVLTHPFWWYERTPAENY